jgi:hypothetical protein
VQGVAVARVVQHPLTLCVAAKGFDAARVGVDQHVLLQAAEPAVQRKLLAAVVALGAGRQHLEHQRRRAKDLLGGEIVLVAGDEQVGVQHGVVGDLQLHALVEDLAGCRLQGEAQFTGEVVHHSPVDTSGPYHREYFAAVELMPLGLLLLPSQVSPETELGLGQCVHGRGRRSALRVVSLRPAGRPANAAKTRFGKRPPLSTRLSTHTGQCRPVNEAVLTLVDGHDHDDEGVVFDAVNDSDACLRNLIL